MKLNKLLILIVLLLPFQVFAQEETMTLNDFVSQLNAACPRVLNDGWTVNSFTLDADTLSVSITVADDAAQYLPMMAANAKQMKTMWIRQIPQYGPYWNKMVERVVAMRKTLVVDLKASEGDNHATFVFSPDELAPKQ